MLDPRFLRLFVLGCLLASPLSAEEVPILKIYTYDSFASEYGPGPALKTAFEAECVCIIEYTAIEEAIGALRRIQLEGATSEADLLIGLDTATVPEAHGTGLFAPHGLDLKGLALPLPWVDPDFVPFDFGYFAFVYDQDRTQSPPTSFEELIGLPESFKIVIQDPRSSTPGLGLLLWIKAAYGERAPEIWAGLKPHILTVTAAWSEAYNLFLTGEADMVLSYSSSPFYHQIAEGDQSIKAASFREGHFPQVEVAGVLKSSDKPDLARDFLAFLISREAQTLIPTTNWMYPVLDLGDELPEAFAQTPQPEKVLSLDQGEIAANSDAWIAEALAAIQ